MKRKRRIHFLPQTVEAEQRGIICLRRLNRDPRDCDGYDCDLETYDKCIAMLIAKQKERIEEEHRLEQLKYGGRVVYNA